MTKFVYDQFAKDYLKELLTPLGEVETSRDVPGEVRSNALLLLANLEATIQASQNIDREEQELVMELSPLLLKWEEEAVQRGLQQGLQQGVRTERRATIENLLRVRFGVLDEELSRIIEPLLELPPEEFAVWRLRIFDLLLARRTRFSLLHLPRRNHH
ncbi:hypothetical protein IQ264_30545 [Phormidium sp. LEGE 05292]|uniref:hypothetical protein n=1 Tax=[Phormidium] sp. LEGE 05292 TaxID=767427 RepID=UPI00187E20E3|nr:hypothetical protein [Phormidium sp. LEGE 05292]MBE9229746.1 hypothetical protein [Phormidium sp. LEGE 05292]